LGASVLGALERHIRRSAIVSLSVLAMIVLFPAALARAQYPPPTPGPTSSPTAGVEVECTIEAGPDFLVIECSGGGFLPGSEVLAEIFGTGCDSSSGEELLATEVLIADDSGNVNLETTISCCDLTALRVVLTGVNEAGDPVEHEVIIEDASVLGCVGGTLSTTGADWLRWLTLGLLLVTAGAWIANVRDEREALATA
jgi:hypothetical protein